MNIKKGEVYIISTTSSQTLMGRISNVHDDYIELEKPVVIVAQAMRTPTGGMQIMFNQMPLPTDDNKPIMVSKSNISFAGEPRTELRDRYIEMTSGIHLSSVTELTDLQKGS